MPKRTDIQSILIVGAAVAVLWLFVSPALAEEEEMKPIAIGQERFLTFTEAGSYNWGRNYRLAVVFIHGGVSKREKLVMDELDGKRKITVSKDTLVGIPDADAVIFDPKTRQLTVDSEFCAGCSSHDVYRLESEPAGKGTMRHHLLLQNARSNEFDLDKHEEINVKTWHRPKGT